MDTLKPCVRCPPADRSIPIVLSPGFKNARCTAKLAGEPEYGCTLACSALNTSFALDIHSFSISSRYSFPP